MTITTAKHPARNGATLLPRLAPLAAAAMLLAAPAQADVRVIPTFSSTLTYTDNVNQQAGEFKHSDMIGQFTPGVTVIGNSRRLQVSGTAQWHQFAYLHDAGRNTNDSQRQYSGALRGILVDDLLFVDASAARGLQSTSAFGPQLGSDLYSRGNRTEVSSWRISPYLVHRFGRSATAQLRYTRDGVDAGDRNLFGKSIGDTVSLNLNSGTAFHTVAWGTSYYRQDLDNALTGESSTESVSANLRYPLTPRFALTADIGYDRYDFEGPGGKNAGRNWSGGFHWAPSQRTSLAASLGRHFYGQTGALDATHRSRRTVWNIKYTDGITTSRSQFLLPAAIDTAAMLDGLFLTAFPDEVERARVVAAYIAANGLPSSLADNVNYLSNRYMREKLLRGSVAYRLARSSAVFGVYASDRVALSDQQSDSPLLGSQLSSLNDNVRQRGADATWTYQLNARTSAIVAWDLRRSQSITTGLVDLQRTYRIGMTRRWEDRMLGVVELRHRIGGTGITVAGNPGYTENAVSASLSMQF